MLYVAYFGDIIRTFLCLAVINMAVLICHSITVLIVLKLLNNAEA